MLVLRGANDWETLNGKGDAVLRNKVAGFAWHRIEENTSNATALSKNSILAKYFEQFKNSFRAVGRAVTLGSTRDMKMGDLVTIYRNAYENSFTWVE